MKKLAIVITHPIQYYSPVFKLLAQSVQLKVFYTWGENSLSKHDPGFDKTIEWDIDLLEGYEYQWQINTAREPGSHHYNGIINPHLIKELTAWQPNAILVYGWAYQSHLNVMRHFKNKLPVFFRGDSTLLDEKPGFKNVLKLLFLKWVYSNVDHAYYNGINNKAYFTKYGLKENQLSFAPHAVDNERFALKRNNDVELLKTQLGLKENDKLIVFAGKLEDKKDPLLLLDAFKDLADPLVHLLFAGNGVLESNLKDQAKEHSNIHFLPFQNQTFMPVIYQAADVFCLPSKGPGETWGLAVNEAMACGKAIIVSDKCGCAVDLVVNNQNGFVFKSGDRNELLTCLKLATTDVDKIANLGKASAEMITPWNFSNIVMAIKTKLEAYAAI